MPPVQCPVNLGIVVTGRRGFVKFAAATVLGPPSDEARPDAGPPRDRAAEDGCKSAPSFVAGDQTCGAQSVQIETGRVQYFECGNPRGEPLLLVHGFPDSPLAWQAVVAGLDLDKHRIVLPFLRGYGESTVTESDCLGGQTAALAHDLLAFADALEIGRFHLAGHDWGARASYSAAVLAPQRIITLTGLASPYLAYRGEPAPPTQVRGYWYQYFFQVEAARRMLDAHRQDFCRELWRAWCPTWHFAEAEFIQAAAAWDGPQFVDVVLDYYRMRHGGVLSRRAYAEAQAKLDAKPSPAINVPTLFVHGDADACDLPEGATGQEAAFPSGYTRLLLPGVGHFPHREDPSAVTRALREHLRD